MAASSSFQVKHDVFLSFRGEDTRNTFTSHLYAALCRKNINTFLDDDQLKKGDELSPIILAAIEGSKISIVIFSENYASSTWCLDELLKIIECKNTKMQIFLPVFYHIDPSHVRKQSGTYERAFIEHKLHNKAKVQKWRKAMREAGKTVGWDSSNVSFHSNNQTVNVIGSSPHIISKPRIQSNIAPTKFNKEETPTRKRLESKLVESIVEDVLQKLNQMIYPQVLDGLVGIHKQIAHIESLLCNGSTNVQIIGIWGMGGIGKTTIADALFKKLCSRFEGCYFVENVREELKKHGKLQLRNKLLAQILGDEKLYINTPSIRSTFVVERLQRRKILIVLDDVSDSQQMEDLIEEKYWLGAGSKIIVTTRNKDVLRNEIDVLYYEVMQLNIEDALHLFSLKAFQQDHPKEEFRDMSKMIINYAKGLPLALKVLGSTLYSKSQGEWESTLKKLKKVPNADIHNMLSLSYEELDSDEKNIFLDIACCLKGETKWHIRSLLDGCGFFTKIGLRSLEHKSLVTISNHGIVNMHDMIQEMGWQIVRQESTKEIGMRSRLWDPEEIYHIFKYKSGTNHSAECISLDMSQIRDVRINPATFARMPNLRLIKFYMPCDQRIHKSCNVSVPKDLEFPLDELCYLRWDCFPLRTLPTSFHAEMLIVLDLKNSLIEKLWDGEQNLKNLKSLCLSDCRHLIELPNLSNAKKLEEIQLVCCTSLRDLPSSIFSLHNLFALDLEGCTELQYIRSDVHSESLRWLSLSYCSRLVELSVTLEKLEYLSLDGTAIEEIPPTVGRSSDLFYLSLSSCKRLRKLPNNTYHMGSSTISKQLEMSPLIFESSLSIKRLRLEGCSNLLELPANFGCYSALNELSLQESSIETLPASIKFLCQLRTLNLSFCRRLRSLPELPILLQELNARDCISLEKVSASAAITHIENCFGSQNKRLLLKQFHESKVSVDHESFWDKFDFTNCMRIDENGRKTILKEAATRIKSAACVSSMLQSYHDPSHQFRLLFKDAHRETLEFIRRRLILNSGFPVVNSLPTWNSLQKIESSAFTIEFNANCCSFCKDSPFAFGLCLSNKGENTGLEFDTEHRACIKNLDGSAIFFYDKLWFNDVNVRLPGSRVPRWFRYRAAGNQITIALASSFHLLGFAFCLVFSPFMPTNTADFICEFHLRGSRIFRSYIFDLIKPTSDTVSLCYDTTTSNRILEAVKEGIATHKSSNCDVELSFEFYGLLDPTGKSEKGIKECGVWPIYAFDLEPEKNKKLEKKRKRNLVFWNWKCRWQALNKRMKKKHRFFKHKNGIKASILQSLNEQQQQQLPPRKKSKRSQDIDQLKVALQLPPRKKFQRSQDID